MRWHAALTLGVVFAAAAGRAQEPDKGQAVKDELQRFQVEQHNLAAHGGDNLAWRDRDALLWDRQAGGGGINGDDLRFGRQQYRIQAVRDAISVMPQAATNQREAKGSRPDDEPSSGLTYSHSIVEGGFDDMS